MQAWYLSKVAYGKKSMTLLEDRGIALDIEIQLLSWQAQDVSLKILYLKVSSNKVDMIALKGNAMAKNNSTYKEGWCLVWAKQIHMSRWQVWCDVFMFFYYDILHFMCFVCRIQSTLWGESPW